MESSSIILKLGDIIEISSPSNTDYDQNTFFIEYIDDAKIKIINVANGQKHSLTLYDNGHLTDESIQIIYLLSRSEEIGYARQNGLIPKKWIDIHFGSEIPTVITGEITNLDEDMIEITTYPDFEVIYINFAYKGIPEHIPILKIHLRERPAAVKSSLAEIYVEDATEIEESDKASIEVNSNGEISVHIPENPKLDKNYNTILDELFQQSNIVFGEEVELEINVEVGKKEQRYGLEIQLKDLMDELLSTIPNYKRTPVVMDRISTIVRRFKELRQIFSTFDANGNVIGYTNISAAYKPLVTSLEKMDRNLRWILPVVKQRNKIFTSFQDDTIVNASLTEDLKSYENKRDVANVQDRYAAFYASINDDLTPFAEPETRIDVLTDDAQKVAADLETIVDNLEEYYSYTFLNGKNKQSNISKHRFVIQKYNMGLSKLGEHTMKSGKRIFLREPMTQNDTIAVKSIVMLPNQAVEFSRVDLPHTNILMKASLSHNWLYYFKLMNKNLSLKTKIIEELDKEVQYENTNELHNTTKFLDSAVDFEISHSILKEDGSNFHSFLNSVIPKTRVLIQMLRNRATAYNFKDMIQYFEPFLLSADNITYSGRIPGDKHADIMSGRGGPYQEIRTHIKELIKKYKAEYLDKRYKYASLLSRKYDDSGRYQLNNIYKLLASNDEYLKLMTKRYKLDSEDSYKNSTTYKSSSEILNKILLGDNGNVCSSMTSLIMSFLYTPNLSNMITVADDGVITSSSKTCSTRVIAKKYTSIRDLQKDNDNSEDIFFGKDYDNTPYPILNKYADDRKKMMATDFIDFLKANLLDKHDANPATVDELVKTLIAGKKKVFDGNYAVLIEYPQLGKTFEEEELSSKEKVSVEIETDAKKKVSYYVRKRGNWTRDQDADEKFALNNDTICYSDKNCVIDKKECLSKEDSSSHMKKIAQKLAMKEYDETTIEQTMHDMESELKARSLYLIDILKKKLWLKESRIEQHDYYAKNLGKYAVKIDIVVSPYEGLRDLILEQTDFVKKQNDIIVFRDNFCRDAIINDYTKESPYWLYCIDSNTKLLPLFLYELAIKYIIGTDYKYELDVVCRKIGRISDDGEAIVDMHTGYIIKSIDFIAEDEYDESGFKLITHEVLEREAGDALKDTINRDIVDDQPNFTIVNKNVKVFENELTQTVYNIARSLCGYMNIDFEPIEGKIISISTKLLNANLYSAEKYKKIEDMNVKKNVVIPSFKTYRNQNIVFFTAATTFVAIQTMIPSFRPSKTFPGCVFSFGGYPLDGGMEYTTGIKYLSCVIEKITGNIEPWNSIKHLKREGIMKRLMEYIGKILKDEEVELLYIKKKNFLILEPDAFVPEVHNVGKWRSFQPPIVPFSIIKSLKNISENFKEELAVSIKTGHKNQHAQIGVIYNKIIQHTYSVIEAVNKIVGEGKEALLKAGTIIFLENACCEERQYRTSIDFFIEKDPNIRKFIEFVKKNGELYEEFKLMTRAAYISPGTKPNSNRLISSNDGKISEENIYAAFIHYCKLLNAQSLVPDDMRIFFQEKPGGMQSEWDLKQVIDHLKKLGKTFNNESLQNLMQLVAKRNLIHGLQIQKTEIQYTRAFSALIERLNSSSEPVIEAKLVDYLKTILDGFDINSPVDNDTTSVKRLKKHLSQTNRKMCSDIMSYIREFGTTRTQSEKDKIEGFLQNLTKWNCDTDMQTSGLYYDEGMYKIVQYVRNAVFMITKSAPAIITGSTHGKRSVFSMKQWGLSDKHYAVLQGHISKYFEKMHSYAKDELICRFFKDINMKMIDLNLFLTHIPVFTPFINDEKLYYLLFDKETLYLLHSYCYYSVLYEIVTESDTDEYLKLDIQEVKTSRREFNKTRNDVVLKAVSEDEYEDLDEVNILTGNRIEFRQRVCDLMMIMIEMDMVNKKTTDTSYEDLSSKSYNESKREKATITDYLKNMTIEERRVENVLKKYKMGRWNLGEQKGVYKYDKERYNIETEEGELYAVHEDQPEEIILEQLDYDANIEAEAEADAEAFDIGGLDEDYNDGVYYQEDRDE